MYAILQLWEANNAGHAAHAQTCTNAQLMIDVGNNQVNQKWKNCNTCTRKFPTQCPIDGEMAGFDALTIRLFDY